MARSNRKIDVELLFQTKTVAEIRQIEAQTSNDIEGKKEQLRQVVGDSYRDLIACADTITGMSQQSRLLASTIDRLDSGLRSLATNVEVRKGAATDASPASSYDRLFAVGSRIKYLVDTPETIYGFLDGAQFLEASQRYVRAVEVHRSFSTTHSQASAKRFPLLRHQWPLVKKLGSEAWDGAVEWLASQAGTSPHQLAGVLAALALLRPVDGVDVLKHHLAARKSYLSSCLSPSQSGESLPALEPQEVGVVLADVATLVCTTIAQCGEVFSTRPGVTSQALLLQVSQEEDVAANELLFDAASTTAFGKTQAMEAAGWQKQRVAACERLASLSVAGLGLECTQWLENLAAHMIPLVSKLLQACSTGMALRTVERAVKQALEEWRYTIGEAGTGEQERLTWADACQWVLGRPVSLWPLLFETAVLERAKALVDADFVAAEIASSELISETVRESAAMSRTLPGVVHTISWSEEVHLDPRPAGGTPGTSDGSVLAPSPSQTLRWWLPHAEGLLRSVDEKLTAALITALDVGEVSDVNASASATPSSSRSLVLHPFVQETCSRVVETMAAELASSLDRLGADPHHEAAERDALSAPEATLALFYGRVAAGLANRSAPLRLLLGPPLHWPSIRAVQSPQSASRQGYTGNTNDNCITVTAQFEAAQTRLRAIALRATDVWARWAAKGLSQRLVNVMATDAAFFADTPLRGWEVVVASAEQEQEQGVEGAVRFLLPSAPSPGTLLALQGACVELERAGGPAADDAPVQHLRWHLGVDSIDALLEAVRSRGPLAGISEKGALQLLFDVSFTDAVLAGSPPPPSEDTAFSNASSSGRKRSLMQLRAALADKLDPVDWASYEPHIATNLTKCVQRSRVMLGLVMQGSPAVAAAATTPAAGGGRRPTPTPPPTESSLLRIAEPGPRFPYLPVNTPPAFLAARQRSQQLPMGGAVSAPTALLEPGDDCHYSFAKLAKKRTERRAPQQYAGSIVGGPAVGAGESAEGGGGVGAAALEAFKQSTIGSLFGDRAADMGLSALGEHVSGTLSSLQLPSFRR